ncbi:hypothetical protein BJ742DRAFT_799169 [Cladochytrium replicatum]|nr:hypothetical protein BJ742DRAFT_799169 [Cladochytrium replicatum]
MLVFEVTIRRGWMMNPIFLDIRGRPTQICTRLPLKGGSSTFTIFRITPSLKMPRTWTTTPFSNVSKIITVDKVDRALLFTHSSAPLTSIVQHLGTFGVMSARLMDRFNRAQELQEMGAAPTQPVSASASTNSSDPFETENGLVNLLVAHENQVYGIGLPTFSHVFILGAPTSEQPYLHLAGRAGRYGKEGRVYTLLDTRVHARKLRSMSKAIDFQFEKLPFKCSEM